MVRTERTTEGGTFYRMLDLKPTRERALSLSRSWNVLHDDRRARARCAGETPASVIEKEVELQVMVIGTDDISMQTVHAAHRYFAKDIVWGARMADVLTETPDGHLQLDLRPLSRGRADGAGTGLPVPVLRRGGTGAARERAAGDDGDSGDDEQVHDLQPEIVARGAVELVEVGAHVGGDRDRHAAVRAFEQPAEQHGVEGQLGHRDAEAERIETAAVRRDAVGEVPDAPQRAQDQAAATAPKRATSRGWAKPRQPNSSPSGNTISAATSARVSGG